VHVRFVFVCRLQGSGIGDYGAADIAACLVHLPQLQTLMYAACPAVSTGPCAQECRVMACVCACVVVFV
jgi:hypothetical protein